MMFYTCQLELTYHTYAVLNFSESWNIITLYLPPCLCCFSCYAIKYCQYFMACRAVPVVLKSSLVFMCRSTAIGKVTHEDDELWNTIGSLTQFLLFIIFNCCPRTFLSYFSLFVSLSDWCLFKLYFLSHEFGIFVYHSRTEHKRFIIIESFWLWCRMCNMYDFEYFLLEWSIL